MDLLTSIAAFAVAIGLLVTVHEYGHFWVARRLGVKVLRFSIGFGKPLWSRTGKDGTEYVVAAIPLGGYVKMLDEREVDVPESERHLAFNGKPLWARNAIVAAGPAMNFLFAIVAYWLIFILGTVTLAPIVGDVSPDSPAAAAGLQARDEIVEVDGTSVRSWDEALMEVVASGVGAEELPLTLERGGERRSVVLDLGGGKRLGEDLNALKVLGISPWRPTLDPVIAEATAGEPAAAAGIGAGDRIVAANGQRIGSWGELVRYVQARPGEQVDLTVVRDGQRRQVPVTLASRQGEDGAIGFLGVTPEVPEGLYEQVRREISYGPIAAIGQAASETWGATALTVRLLWKMVLGEASVKNLSGPINIAHYAGESASLGLAPFLKFLAIVSISLGVLNLLPVPVLDGGHLFFNAIEAVRGRPLSESAQNLGYQIGLVLLLMLMTLALYNDLLRVFGTH